MVQIKFSLDTSSYDRNARRVIRQYRKIMFTEIANVLDNTRRDSTKYIIRRDPKLSRVRSPYRMAKLQPAHPSRLTERTGALLKMLRSESGWTINSSTARQKTDAFKGLVKVTHNKGTALEHYEGTLRTDITGNFAWKTSSWVKTSKGMRRAYFDRDTKQTLAIRFRHDSPGIRGRKRPFLTKALTEQKPQFENIVERKLNALGEL